MHTAQTHITLAVLPFQVLAEDPKVDMFSQGLVMDLITDLSRFRSFQLFAQDAAKAIQFDETFSNPNWQQLQPDYLDRKSVV